MAAAIWLGFIVLFVSVNAWNQFGIRANQPLAKNLVFSRVRRRPFYEYGNMDYGQKMDTFEFEPIIYPKKQLLTVKPTNDYKTKFATQSLVNRHRSVGSVDNIPTRYTTGVTFSQLSTDSSQTLTSTSTQLPSPMKVLFMELIVPNNISVSSLNFQQSLANRLSYALYVIESVDREDDYLPGKPYGITDHFSDVKILKITRLNEKNPVVVNVVFSLIYNSSVVNADIVANLIRFKVRPSEFSKILGYDVKSMPKATLTTAIPLHAGVGINKFLRIDFTKNYASEEQLYHIFNGWLNEYFAPLAVNLSQPHSEPAAIITNLAATGMVATVEFTINFGRPDQQTAQEIATRVFTPHFPLHFQDSIGFTLVSAGYLFTKHNRRDYIAIYNGTLTSQPKPVKTILKPSNVSTTNKSESKQLTLSEDTSLRIVFDTSEAADTREKLEILARNWLNDFVAPFTQGALNTPLNASVFVANVTFPPRRLVIDFAVIFHVDNRPYAANATELIRLLLNDNFKKVQSSAQFPIVSGGYINDLYGNGTKEYIQIPIYRTYGKSSNTDVVIVDTLISKSDTNASEEIIQTGDVTTTKASSLSIEITLQSEADTVVTSAVELLITTTTPPGVNISLNSSTVLAVVNMSQLVRIVFEPPKKEEKEEKEIMTNVEKWIHDFVTPFIKTSFQVEHDATATTTNWTIANNTLSVDFFILFYGQKTMVANSTEVAVELFSNSLSKVVAEAPYDILSGGYLASSSEGDSTYVVIYSSAHVKSPVKSSVQPHHILHMEIRVLGAIDVESSAFKNSLADKLRGSIFPVIQQPSVSEEIYLNSESYSTLPAIFDIIIVEVGKEYSDKEIVSVNFGIVADSKLLDAVVAANVLAIHLSTEDLQKGLGYTVTNPLIALSSVKRKPVKFPEPRLWIIAAVIVPLIVVIILINICICTCCRSGGQNNRLKDNQHGQGLPHAGSDQANAQYHNGMYPYPYPYMYYYPPPPGVMPVPAEMNKATDETKNVTIRVPETNVISSPEASLPSISPPSRLTYSRMRHPRNRGIRKSRGRVRPIEQQDTAVISQVASSLLSEALRNISQDGTMRASSSVLSNNIVHVSDQNCQTDNLTSGNNGKAAWTREYEQSLLRLASMVVSPNGVQPSIQQPSVDKSTGYITLPEHGTVVAHALKDTAKLGDPQAAVEHKIEAETVEKQPDKSDGEYLNMDDSHIKQVERLNALFISLPPISDDITGVENTSTPKEPVANDNKREFSDEHDVIVDSLRPGVPPRRLLEALRTELENYGQK